MQLIKKGEKRGGKGDQKKGKNLSQDTIYLVKALYEDNDFFRKCLKKSVSRNIHKQKRLILLNLNELLLTSNSNMSVLALIILYSFSVCLYISSKHEVVISSTEFCLPGSISSHCT